MPKAAAKTRTTAAAAPAEFVWDGLDQYKAEKRFLDGYPPDQRSFFSPRDDLHPMLASLLASAQHSVVLNMYGYDDDQLDELIRGKLDSKHVYVQMSLDKSQAGGVHEKELLAKWSNDQFGNSIAIGTSEVHHAISHLKVLIVDGVYTVTGSTNWSISGEFRAGQPTDPQPERGGRLRAARGPRSEPRLDAEADGRSEGQGSEMSDPAAGDALARLQSIKHIVVLMMENRSFDQMLGFLQGAGLDVDGLAGAKPNFDAGKEYPPFQWGLGETLPPTPSGHKPKILDPCHSPGCVHKQLKNGNTGFVENFAETRVEEGKKVELDPEFLKVPMGHFGAQHLPVYDHLAKNFCVCDAWHASIPGDTWPNRQYSIAGKAGEAVTQHSGFLHDLLDKLKGMGIGNLGGLPIFEDEAFTRQLEDSQWRWYSHDPATLRGIDPLYRDFHHVNRDNFAYFDRKKVSWDTELAEAAIVTHDSFLDDAAKGQLRDVSWIDPNFIDLSVLDPNSNDDHPPSDVKAGQALVLEIYEALAKSPNWQDTMFVIVYDEHGGFYDHVPPPSVADDGSGFTTLGVRVPAIVVGPRVRNHVSHEVFEHTSLIATIMRRFAADPEKALAAMPKRVQDAPHLGVLLEDGARADLEPTAHLRKEMSEWRRKSREERRALKDGKSPAPDGAGHAFDLHDFQEEFARLALLMRHALPPGQP